MGRTNGKLLDFLKDALHMEKYINLTYDSEKFELYLPRYGKNMKADYEIILKDWFAVNHRKYVNYSNGKSVLKAAMKKSPYIISLKPDCKKLQFRFSSPVEIQEKRKRQKERQAELYKNISKEEMPPSVASSGYISGDNSPDPFEAHDQLKDSNFDNPVDAVMTNNGDCNLRNDDFFIGTMNDSSYKNMEIKDDEIFANTTLDEPGKEDCNISIYDINDLYKNYFGAYDVSLPYDSLLGHLPLHADQSSVAAESDSGTLDNLQPSCTHDFTNGVNDLPELTNQSSVAAESDSGTLDNLQLSCTHDFTNGVNDLPELTSLNQPESAIENSEIASSLVQIPEEKQHLWICFDKKHIGPIVEYICKPLNLTSLAKANSAYQLESIIENSNTTSCVLISTTHWEPDRSRKQHMVISDGKYLIVFYE